MMRTPNWRLAAARSAYCKEKAGDRIKVSELTIPRLRVELMPGRIPSAARLVKEPHAPLGLIDPNFDEARGGDVVLLVAQIMHLAHASDQRLVVGSELCQHV
jgi:hypothetical protein